MMYQLFFFGIGLDKLATDRYEVESIAMKYEGVQWFRSRRITPESPLELTTHSIPELNLDRRPPGLELFIQLEGVDENNLDPSEQCATLIIEQHPTTKQNIVSEFPLQQVRQQRLHTKWLTSTPTPRFVSLSNLKSGFKGSKQVPNVFRVSLKIPEGSPVQSILLGTKIHANLHSLAWPWFIGGCILFFAWISAGHRWKSKPLWMLCFTILTLLFFRAGAFISNDFFLDTSGNATVFKTSFGHLRHWLAAGEWYPHVYKPAGSFILPTIMMIVEPFSVLTPTNYYVETYPLPRYVWFLAETAGVLVLVRSLYKYMSPKVAVVFPLIYVTFPPILFDVYNMEDDALLILGMLFLTALLIRMSANSKLILRDLLLCSGVMFFMLFAKITVAFLVVIIPLAIFIARRVNCRSSSSSGVYKTPLVLLLLLFATFGIGKTLNAMIRPSIREAQPGFVYQNHNVWEMLWAAAGQYDRNSAHTFNAGDGGRGPSRDNEITKRVANQNSTTVEQLFPQGVKRMRHSKLGDELLYKPGLATVWNERPTYFLNYPFIRNWEEGSTLFYGYPGRGKYWNLTTTEHDRKSLSVVVTDNGGEVIQANYTKDGIGQRQIDTLILRSRFDEVWKIGPLIYITSLFNLDQPQHRLANIVLSIIAVLGIVCIGRLDLGIIFLSCVLAKIFFNTFIHAMIRYFDWVHVPMLVGLSVILSIMIALVWNQSKNLIKKPIDTPLKPHGES